MRSSVAAHSRPDVPASGGAWLPITDGQAFDDKPRWSKDGRILYYLSHRDGFFNVWGRRFNSSAGKPQREPFRVTTFRGDGRMISPENISEVEIAVAGNRLVVPLTDVSSQRLKVSPVAGLPLVHLEPCRSLHAARWAKRVFDVLGALCLLVVLAPLMAATARAVKLPDGGPALFRHTRVGRDGLPFGVLKFRSMVVDAEQLRGALVGRSTSQSILFKMADDPRVTGPGRWIRRFSLDELPQLWNVVTGQMSLVGPRPPLPEEVARYEDDMLRRLRVRPGMTGLWQVSGRSDLSWDDSVRLDLYYVDNWSMVQDLAILARTFRAVVGSQGAY